MLDKTLFEKQPRTVRRNSGTELEVETYMLWAVQLDGWLNKNKLDIIHGRDISRTGIAPLFPADKMRMVDSIFACVETEGAWDCAPALAYCRPPSAGADAGRWVVITQAEALLGRSYKSLELCEDAQDNKLIRVVEDLDIIRKLEEVMNTRALSKDAPDRPFVDEVNRLFENSDEYGLWYRQARAERFGFSPAQQVYTAARAAGLQLVPTPPGEGVVDGSEAINGDVAPCETNFYEPVGGKAGDRSLGFMVQCAELAESKDVDGLNAMFGRQLWSFYNPVQTEEQDKSLITRDVVVAHVMAAIAGSKYRYWERFLSESENIDRPAMTAKALMDNCRVLMTTPSDFAPSAQGERVDGRRASLAFAADLLRYASKIAKGRVGRDIDDFLAEHAEVLPPSNERASVGAVAVDRVKYSDKHSNGIGFG